MYTHKKKLPNLFCTMPVLPSNFSIVGFLDVISQSVPVKRAAWRLAVRRLRHAKYTHAAGDDDVALLMGCPSFVSIDFVDPALLLPYHQVI